MKKSFITSGPVLINIRKNEFIAHLYFHSMILQSSFIKTNCVKLCYKRLKTLRPKKILICFSGHFFKKQMRQGDFLF